jgi:hypothetical protein
MKPMPEFLCVFLLAGAVAGVFFQQRALWKARSDNQPWREADKEAQLLAGENATIDRWREESREIQKLRNETKDLHKLRNEVRQLREQKPAWDKLRAENQRLRVGAKSDGSPASGASQPANMIAKERLSDAGFGSPEAAIQTLFWALCEGNIGRIRNCFSEEAIKKGNGLPIEQAQGGAPPMMAGFKSFRVVAKKAVAADQVELGIQISADETLPVEVVLPLKRVDGEWKVNMALSP